VPKMTLCWIMLGAVLGMPVVMAEEATKAQIVPDAVMAYKHVKTENGEFDLKLHVFNPKKAAGRNYPCIVVIHGGGWINGSPVSTYGSCRRYASLGLVAIAVEYRIRSAHGATALDSVRDAKSAMRWIRSHVSELNIDPDRIVATGGSAGGHLAAACAFLSAFDEEGEDISVSCRPNALMLTSPVFDNSPKGYGHYQKPIKDNWKDFSPLHNIGDWAPPTLIFVGDEEPKHLRIEAAKEFQKKVTAAGSVCELFVLEGATHYKRTKEHGALMRREQETFLKSLGYLGEAREEGESR
jgi:acetyl esterase/lipase